MGQLKRGVRGGDHSRAGPGSQALGAGLVAVAGLGPQVGRVDGAVAVDIGAILVGELVHAIALSGCGGQGEGAS